MLRPTRVLLQHRQPMIRFLGNRHGAPSSKCARRSKQPSACPHKHPFKKEPSQLTDLGPRTALDHTPQPHPASPTHSLPDSFASYRKNAQQHGPLGGQSATPSSQTSSRGGLGGKSGHSLGSIQPTQGQYFDRSELPMRFQRTNWSPEEIEAIESGGASMWA